MRVLKIYELIGRQEDRDWKNGGPYLWEKESNMSMNLLGKKPTNCKIIDSELFIYMNDTSFESLGKLKTNSLQCWISVYGVDIIVWNNYVHVCSLGASLK